MATSNELNIIPKEIDARLIKILESHGVSRYYLDYDENIAYVDDLEGLGRRLGKLWMAHTETGIYQGYWFRELVSG